MGKFTSITRAYEALRNVAPDLNKNQLAILLGQAKAESDFGDGFETPDGNASSNNWGAIYTSGDLGTITRWDTDGNGKPIQVKAAWNSSPEVGAKQFYDLIKNNYAPALDKAAAGDLWGYSEALWRNGPCDWPEQAKGCTRPAYYGGFPPGHKYGLAPASVVPKSPEDRWYRILAYAKFIKGMANVVVKALGWPDTLVIEPPPKPGGEEESSMGGSGLLAAGLIGAGAYLVWRSRR